MNKKDSDCLAEQIKAMILSRPISDEIKSNSIELAELQEAIEYLSNCLLEVNIFVKNLSIGNLQVKPPSRYNFLSAPLKELHSALKHLTWQANQVANGDYEQQVSFQGVFSKSFNKMIYQLAERENKLKDQSVMLKKSVDLIKSIMDGLRDFIVVTSKETGEVIFVNDSAKKSFYNIETKLHSCSKKSCDLLEYLVEESKKGNNHSHYEFECPVNNKILQVNSFLILWDETLVYAHHIIDITSGKKYEEQIKEMAYTDVLTGLYNRRYFLDELELFVKSKKKFSFCMIDADALKFANDKFGHVAGDNYLKVLAEQMENSTRSTDILARFGGDEFAILFPNCSESAALAKMKQLDQTIISLSKDYPMSISYGVVYIGKEDEITSQEVVEQADSKMYAFKKIRKFLKNNPI